MIADVDQLSTDCVITGVKLLFSDHSKHIIILAGRLCNLVFVFLHENNRMNSVNQAFICKGKTLPRLHVGVVCLTFLFLNLTHSKVNYKLYNKVLSSQFTIDGH